MKARQVTVDGEKWYQMRVPLGVMITDYYLWKRERDVVRMIKFHWCFHRGPSKKELARMVFGREPDVWRLTIPVDIFRFIARCLEDTIL